MRLVWRYGEKATGRYKSFHKRAWPQAYYGSKDGHIAIALFSTSGEGYHPIFKETMQLKVHVADYRPEDGKWVWRKIKQEATGVTQAQALAYAFLKDHPEFRPKEYQ